MSPVGVSRRSIAALVCLALAATPAVAQVKADGTPVQTTPTVKRDNSGAAAAAAGAIAIGTAIWLHHRAEEKKKAEAAAAAAAATPPVPAPAQTVATPPVATEPVPAPATVEPAPKPVAVVAKKAVHLSHHGSSTSSNLKAAAVVPAAPAAVSVAEPVQAAPVVRAAPLPAAAPQPVNNNFALWIALGVLGALLLAVGALPRMRMAPPTFRARARMSTPRVSVPMFTQSKVEAA